MDNPFTPSYGSIPLLLPGRREIIDQVMFGLENGPGDPNRSTVLTGPRGSGKTVLMRQIAEDALGLGWITVYVVANKNLLGEILRKLQKAAKEFIEDNRNSTRLKGIKIGSLGIDLELKTSKKTWEESVDEIVDKLTNLDIGVVFEIDEVRGVNEQLRRFASFHQDCISASYKTSLIMAGLPHNIERLFKDKDISFIRRSRKQVLGTISLSEARVTIRKTVVLSGKLIDDEALDLMTAESAGYPYLIQLIGYEVWQVSKKKRISAADALTGIENAQRHIDSSLIELVLDDISEQDRAFLIALSETDGPMEMSKIADLLEVDQKYAGVYRRRLIKEGIIESSSRGYVDFVLPQFRKYLRDAIE